MRLIDGVLNTPVAQISIPGTDLDEVAEFLLYGRALLFDVGGDLRTELCVVVVRVPQD